MTVIIEKQTNRHSTKSILLINYITFTSVLTKSQTNLSLFTIHQKFYHKQLQMGNCTKPAHQLASLSGDDVDVNLPRTHLTMRASTWQRDSHELFDYESPNLRRKTLELNQATSLTRDPDDEINQIIAADVIKSNKKVLTTALPTVGTNSVCVIAPAPIS